ncbi:phytoene desaturase family protein [Alkalicoccobacillus porphyridii]|uniref:4,4'-diaponeurosporene oxygenase n=1 Tax=Alkalicoccobacillus porphyridii TaxID=2597270 RepID=A0A553ZYR3_9BACI|nr:phytoene desaturase family protein [Alkalicoccobacillus porphyridii]TSB46587.1 phytoene desaturase [Alkalicoccobacillus porphyridii]
MKTIVIIGGGLGGLSSAISLARKGYKVHVLEKNNHFGGKMRRYHIGNASFDFGPNTITMPEIFQKVISQTGANPDHYFTFERIVTHTRNHFSDGTYLDMSSDADEMKQNLAPHSISSSSYEHYLAEITRLYQLSKEHFFPRTFTGWTDYLSPTLTKALLSVHPLQNLDTFHRRYFKDERVVQMLNRYATYIGSSPYQTPATFAMIAYLELVQGVYYVRGGNPTIAEGFVKRATELGVTLHTNKQATRIQVEQKKAVAVECEDGSYYPCDEVILNGDLLQVYPDLVAEEHRPSFLNKKRDQLQPSISAFVILVSLNTRLKDLRHHQVYFSRDYKQEFDDLFKQQQYSMDPTIYICNSSFTEPALSPDGDNLFILVNAPALTEAHTQPKKLESYKQHIYSLLESKGIPIHAHLIKDQVITPKTIQKDYSAYRGALYGLAANTKRHAFLRPQNKAQDLKNLYFVGGSTHPGGGSPMVVLSGLNVARLISKK